MGQRSGIAADESQLLKSHQNNTRRPRPRRGRAGSGGGGGGEGRSLPRVAFVPLVVRVLADLGARYRGGRRGGGRRGGGRHTAAHGGPPGTRARRSRAPAERRRSAGARPWLPHISMAEARRRRTSRAHRALARRWRRTHPKATVLHGAPAARRAAARWAAHLLAFHISHRPLTSQPLCRKKVLWSTSGLIR